MTQVFTVPTLPAEQHAEHSVDHLVTDDAADGPCLLLQLTLTLHAVTSCVNIQNTGHIAKSSWMGG